MVEPTQRSLKGEGGAAALDWILFAALVALGGSSFAFIKTAVATIPPPVVATGRLWLAAVFLYAVMRFAGRRFPPLVERSAGALRLRQDWASMLAVSAIGYAVPFLIFPWAQQYVASGLAGVYMAFMPLWTLALAYFFANEGLSPSKLAGFALGLAGVLILMGPDIAGGAAQSGLLAQAGLLVATLCYAVSVVVSRRAPPIDPRVFACGTVLGGAILASPALLFADLAIADWSLASLLSVVALAIGPTALAGLIIIVIVQRVGAGFMALANYLTPVFAVAIGAALFHERLEATAFIALGVILAGVAVSRRQPKSQISS